MKNASYLILALGFLQAILSLLVLTNADDSAPHIELFGYLTGFNAALTFFSIGWQPEPSRLLGLSSVGANLLCSFFLVSLGVFSSDWIFAGMPYLPVSIIPAFRDVELNLITTGFVGLFVFPSLAISFAWLKLLTAKSVKPNKNTDELA